MTLPKKVAKTLTGIMDHPVMKIVLDRSEDVTKILPEVQSWWGYDLFSRRPGIAITDENQIITDLDLSCFLFELADRNAIINIPEYRCTRPRSIKEGMYVVSSENRHGEILGLLSNQETFSFSLRIKDMNTISSRKVGAFKSFALTDLNGNWYEYCKVLQFIPDEKENQFLVDHNILATNGTIGFEYFVHPSRWSAIFGHHYMITKALIQRLKEESRDWTEQINEMLKIGIRYPKTGSGKKFEGWPETEIGAGKKVMVESFQIEMEFPQDESRFNVVKYNEKNLVYLTKLRKQVLNKILPKLNFAVRTCEYAYSKFGNDRIPHWLKNVKWEHDFVVPGKRIKWDRVILFQRKPGELGISLKKRTHRISQNVSLNY